MSASVTSDHVQQLRAKSGAGIMDCKRALQTANGDMDKAYQILREQGAASAAKRAGRVAGDGLVTVYVDPKGSTAVLAELNSETDFVARTDDFKALLTDLTKAAALAKPAWPSADAAPKEKITELAAKLGENIVFRRLVRYDSSGGLLTYYIHPTGLFGKVGVLMELAAPAPALALEEVKALGRDLAMQVAAMKPKHVGREDVSAAVLDAEREIARQQAKKENKPEKIWDKIADGKVQQYYKIFCLLEQPFVKDPQGKSSVKQLLDGVAAKAGGAVQVKRFARFAVGEEE